MKKEGKKEPKKKSFIRRIFTSKIFWILVFIILVALSVKFYYVFSLLLGNDYIVTLKTSNETLFLDHGSSQLISFQSTMLASPFCAASCTYEFVDVSSKRILEGGNMTLKPAIPQSKYFELSTEKIGRGQDIYRFDVRCTGVSSLLCSISNNQRSRSAIVTINYDLNDEDKSVKEGTRTRITNLWEERSKILQQMNYLSSLIGSLGSLEINDSKRTVSFEKELNNSEGLLLGAKNSWENLDFDNASIRLDDSGSRIAAAEDYFFGLNASLFDSVYRYNLLISNLTVIKNELEESKKGFTNESTSVPGKSKKSLSNESTGTLAASINCFNAAVASLGLSGTIEDKESRVNYYLSTVSSNSSSENLSVSDLNINDVPGRIELIWNLTISPSEINLTEPSPVCCLFGKCDACCIGDSCGAENYPVILLHGHAFNKGISAEYSLETFQKFQDKLENDGLLNGGSILIGLPSEQRGILSGVNYPVTLRASYYFDIFRGSESSVIQTKSENIDSYALRLKDIVDTVKLKTGKKKVIIVAHSMGGLVTRKYMQIYGSESLDKVVLIATPNKGIEPNIFNLCSIVGASLECQDMKKDSLFLNKLNYNSNPIIPVYNIIGTGCKMGDAEGDGTVTKENAFLTGAAANYYINGSCDELKLNFLHEKIVDPETHPEVYSFVSEVLKA